jgi:hypothetical protein
LVPAGSGRLGTRISLASNEEIIVNDLSMGGTSAITMELNPNYLLPVDQVALVQ